MDIVRFFYRFSHRKASLSGRVGKRVVLEGQSKQKMKNTISTEICVFAVGFSFYLDPNISDKKITLQMIYCKQSTLDLRFKRLCASHWHDVPTFPAEQLPSTLPTFSHLADFSASCCKLQPVTRWMFKEIRMSSNKMHCKQRDWNPEWRHWVVCAIGMCLHAIISPKINKKRKSRYLS